MSTTLASVKCSGAFVSTMLPSVFHTSPRTSCMSTCASPWEHAQISCESSPREGPAVKVKVGSSHFESGSQISSMSCAPMSCARQGNTHTMSHHASPWHTMEHHCSGQVVVEATVTGECVLHHHGAPPGTVQGKWRSTAGYRAGKVAAGATMTAGNLDHDPAVLLRPVPARAAPRRPDLRH